MDELLCDECNSVSWEEPTEQRQTVLGARAGLSDDVTGVREDTAVRISEVVDRPDDQEQRKARGAYFTPRAITDYIARWTIAGGTRRVLEPSCGDAEFLLALARVAATAQPAAEPLDLYGIEIHSESAADARARLGAARVDASIQVADFFDVSPGERFDAVVGNPPYIRFQEFIGAQRAKARSAALSAGVNLSGLASSWAAFTVYSTEFLRVGGKLALVLPAELLSVNYASPVRRFLMERFARVKLVTFEERVFPGALEDVVLLLADGYGLGPTTHATITQVRSAAELAGQPASYRWTPSSLDTKWVNSLLPAGATDIYESLTNSNEFSLLADWGRLSLGAVTGSNKYFTMSPARARELELEPRDVLGISPPGSRHLRLLSLTKSALVALGERGENTLMFRPGGEPSGAGKAYIRAGEVAGVNEAYKCRVRNPWWRVPIGKPADMILTYMNSEAPRLVANTAKAVYLNSVHGLYLDASVRKVGQSLLPLASLNSVTLLGAELVGRSYGGGMLKLEPGEATRLPLPSIDTVERSASALQLIRRRVLAYLKEGRLLEASTLVDEALFDKHGTKDLVAVREARSIMRDRRFARGAGVTQS